MEQSLAKSKSISRMDDRLYIALNPSTMQKQYEDATIEKYLQLFREAAEMYVADMVFSQIESRISVRELSFKIQKQEFYNSTIRLREAIICERDGTKSGLSGANYYLIEKWMTNQYHQRSLHEMWEETINKVLHDVNSSITRVTEEKVILMINDYCAGYFDIKSVRA